MSAGTHFNVAVGRVVTPRDRIDEIVAKAAKQYGLSVEEIRQGRKFIDHSRARWTAIHHLRDAYPKMTLGHIGRAVGVDHSSVHHALSMGIPFPEHGDDALKRARDKRKRDERRAQGYHPHGCYTRLTPDQVRAIKAAMRKGGEGGRTTRLAMKYEVDASTIQKIRSGQTWAHIA